MWWAGLSLVLLGIAVAVGAVFTASGWVMWVLLVLASVMSFGGCALGFRANIEADRAQRAQFREWDREDRRWR